MILLVFFNVKIECNQGFPIEYSKGLLAMIFECSASLLNGDSMAFFLQGCNSRKIMLSCTG